MGQRTIGDAEETIAPNAEPKPAGAAREAVELGHWRGGQPPPVMS